MRNCTTLILDRLDLRRASSEKPAEHVQVSDFNVPIQPFFSSELILFMDDDKSVTVMKNRYGGNTGTYKKAKPVKTTSVDWDSVTLPRSPAKVDDFEEDGLSSFAPFYTYEFRKELQAALSRSDEDWDAEYTSRFERMFPVLSNGEARAFRRDTSAMGKLRSVFCRYLKYLGFSVTGTLGVGCTLEIRPGNWKERQDVWLVRDSRQFKIIGGVLRCLKSLGLEADATAFYKVLEPLYFKHHRLIGTEVWRDWKKSYRDTLAV